MPKRKICSKYQRSFYIEKREIDEEARTVELAFSSEEPYERWFGIEILDHGTGAVNLKRLKSGGAVLVNHNTKDHVGVVESARIDSDRRGRAVVRFGKGALASEIFNDVVDGIRQLVSVGYSVDKYEVEKKGKEGQPDVYRITAWTPHEISIVAVPADASVGVGRSNDDNLEEIEMPREINKDEKKPEAPAVNIAAVTAKARKDEQERIRKITALGDEHDCAELAREYVDSGKEWPAFQTEVLRVIGERNIEARAGDAGDEDKSFLGLDEKEKKAYSLTRAMLAIANPNNKAFQEAAAFEMEVSEQGAKKLGITARGLFVPSDVSFRALSAGGATAGAELVATDLMASSFIDALRERLVTAQAGMTILTGLVGSVEIPRKTSGAVADWVAAEDGDAGLSEPSFDQVSMTPKDLAVYTEVTRRLMMQSTPSIDGIVRDDLAKGMATGIDHAALYGSGAAGQPTGIANQTGINTFNFAAANPTYAETVRMVREIMADNADIGALSYIIAPDGWEAAMTTAKDAGSGQFIMSESGTINGYSHQVTSQVTPGHWFFGNFADLLLGLWGGLELNVDPYTHSLKGKTRYVMFQTADVAVRHPESFILCNDGV